MARGQTDSQIFWVVVLAAALWVGIWQHDAVLDWIHHVSVSHFGIR